MINVQAATIYVPDDYESIQQAIDNANDGDTIIVRDGIYYENVKIDKSVTLKSENGSANCIIDGSKRGNVVTVIANGVVIDGFTVRNSSWGWWVSYAGIFIVSDCNVIKNNNISNNGDGISLWDSSNNKLTSNRVENNSWGGIHLYESSNNIITNNKVENNGNGILLDESNNNTITNNTMTKNKYNFHISGWKLSHFIQSIDTTNTVDGKPIYYLVNQSDTIIPSDAGFVGVVNCQNITVRDSVLTNNYVGVLFVNTSNSRIENVSALNNDYGIYLRESSNNIITSNKVENNKYGIYLSWSSNNNTIYLNSFVNNTNNVHSYESTNIWNSTKRITYEYNGKNYTNYLGNYWSDYEGEDENNDGIGDEPYQIDLDKDSYPLIAPIEQFKIIS